MNVNPNVARVPELIRSLYAIVDEFEDLFPGRHFTPDGHLVGSLGESIVAYLFDVELMPASTESFDALTQDGQTVEIKATQGSSIAVSVSPIAKPDYLIVLKLMRDGNFEVVFNGPGFYAWELAGLPQKTGQRRLSLSKLKAIRVDEEDQLPVVRSL